MMTNRGDDGDRPSGIASWREELMLLGEEMEVVVVTVRMAVVKQWRRNRGMRGLGLGLGLEKRWTRKKP